MLPLSLRNFMSPTPKALFGANVYHAFASRQFRSASTIVIKLPGKVTGCACAADTAARQAIARTLRLIFPPFGCEKAGLARRDANGNGYCRRTPKRMIGGGTPEGAT